MPPDHVSNAGRKLAAALDRFALGTRVRGARAVDVGASTGGFTEVLLRQGATRVTAVDVGTGQLVPALAADPRVESLEGTDWKRLALDVAPGPFDFFTVDVSFVAARNMLRGLAFRLRPGAEGVVLVKPQFELPSRLVKGGDVADPALRARALESFREKATELGFRVVAHADSPVAGGSGTIEILTHVVFDGRSAKLPQPGETRGQAPRARKQGPALPATLRWFVVAAPGLEEVVRAEVEALPGARAVRAVTGGVELEGGVEVGMRANLHLRAATRVLVRLGEVRAREFAVLRRKVGELPWRALVREGERVKIAASATRSRLYHTGGIAEQVTLALRDAVGSVAEKQGEGADEDDGDVLRVLIRGEEDVFTVSVDSSGALLHRRGWRTEAGKAPLRETLAAGMLALAGYRGDQPFVDPMCGAGTIALEACAMALGLAPGLRRSFAFQRWARFDADVWGAIVRDAEAAVRGATAAPVCAFDRDLRAVEIARRNAERAEMSAHVTIEQAVLGERTAPGGRGLVLLNPPYGRRLHAGGQARLGREITRALRARFGGWRAAVVVADAAMEKGLGVRPHAVHRLVNGGMKVKLVVFDVEEGTG